MAEDAKLHRLMSYLWTHPDIGLMLIGDSRDIGSLRILNWNDANCANHKFSVCEGGFSRNGLSLSLEPM